MPSIVTSRVTPNQVLVATLIVFAVLAIAVAFETPPGEANDEPSHLTNVESIVAGRMYRISPTSGSESHQAPLYYGVLAAWQKALGIPPFGLALRGTGGTVLTGPHWRHDGATATADQRRLDLLRLPGIAMGLATIALTWLAVRCLSKDPWTPVIAAAIVAFVPRFVFLSGVINNDNLATLLGALVTFLAAWLVSRRPDRTRVRVAWAAASGAVLGAALLAKVTAVVVGPGLFLALLVVARRPRERLVLVSVMATGALAVCGWWFVRNQLVYGDPLGEAASVAHLRALYPNLFPTGSLLVRVLVSIPVGVWTSAWYTSGWNQFSWPPLAYLPFWILLGIGGAAAIAGLARRSTALPDAPADTHASETTASRSRAGIAILATIALGGAAAIWIVGLQTTQAQARIGYVGLPAVAGLAAIGYERLRWPTVARLALPALGLVGTLIAIRADVLGVFH